MESIGISEKERAAYSERQSEVWTIAVYLFKEWASEHSMANDSTTSAQSVNFIRMARVFVDEFQNLLPDIPAEPKPEASAE